VRFVRALFHALAFCLVVMHAKAAWADVTVMDGYVMQPPARLSSLKMCG
jgi:hypothetical protein